VHDVPLFLLCTARPDLFESRPDWTTPRPNATLLTLEPLETGASAALVGQLGELPEEMQRRIVEAAEGNPLFIEQLVAMHIESGGAELEVPPTLQALLAARIDRLAAEERSVVECGSVEGRLFHRGAVAELLPAVERQALGAHLLTLVRKELIRPDRGTVPGDDGFRFGHVLIRDAAYQAMPKRQRAVLHEGYAGWLATKLGEAAPDEIVGYHLEQAYRYQAELGSAEEGLAARAAERLAGAASSARQRQDAAATDNLLTRAVELAPDGPLRRRLLCDLAETLIETGDVERARVLLSEALAVALAAHDGHVEWLARTLQATTRVTTEPAGEEHLAEVRSAIAAREPYGDHDVLARAWRLAAEVHLLRAEALEQTGALEHAIAEARAAGDVALEAQLVIQSVPPLLFGPVPVEDALAYVDRVLESSSLPSLESFALHVRGHMWARRGNFDRALEAIEQWRRPLPELGQELAYATSAACVWDVCSLAGEWARAEPALRAAYETLERRGERGFRSTLAAQLGECVLRQGLIDEAEQWSLLSEELGVEEDRVNEAWWRSLRAKAHAARGDLAHAEELAREAVAIMVLTDHLEPTADMWLALAEVLQARGSSEAPAAAREALDRYKRKGNLVAAERASTIVDPEHGKAGVPTPAPAT
jgi:tetratricopeptide (TPR) repeat protein